MNMKLRYAIHSFDNSHHLGSKQIRECHAESSAGCLDAARTPHLNGGCLPVGTLNFVKAHDPDDLFGFVGHFLVVMSYEFGDKHAALRELMEKIGPFLNVAIHDPQLKQGEGNLNDKFSKIEKLLSVAEGEARRNGGRPKI
jgi:hypothetical protein